MKDALARGKAILLGEHAVVYGVPALAVGLNQGLSLDRWSLIKDRIQLQIPAWDIDLDDDDDSPVGRALQCLRDLLPTGETGISLHLSGDLPPGVGLGGSAALSVALVRAISTAFDLNVDNEAVRKKAHEMETVFHGTPSGLDDALATYGGVCLFRRGGIGDDLPDLGHVTTERLSDELLRIDVAPPLLAVGDTGRPRSTADMVAGVRRLWESRKEKTEALFEDIRQLVVGALDALIRKDWAVLGQAMNSNQEKLESLGVSGPEIERMNALAIQAGALGSKLTGGGGGGCVIALAQDDDMAQAIAEAWKANGYKVYSGD